MEVGGKVVGRGGGERAGGFGAVYDFRRNVPLPCTNIYIGLRNNLVSKKFKSKPANTCNSKYFLSCL